MTTSSPTAAADLSAKTPPRGHSLSAIATLYWLTLRGYRHGKRWMVLTALVLLLAGLALLMRHTAPDVPGVELEFIFVFMLIPQALLPLVALIYASGIIQDELEEQTFTYLLIRPIAKWAIYAAKLAATLTTTVLLTVLFTALIYAAIYTGAGQQGALLRCLKACGIHSLAVVTYCCLFGLLSLLTRRVLIVGIIYTVVVEGLLANLPFGIRLITVIFYSRIIAYRAVAFIVPTPSGPSDFAANTWQLDIASDPKLLQYPTLGHCLIVLFAASCAGSLLAMALCSRREFHVKTPEKAE